MRRPGIRARSFRRRRESGFALLMIFLMASAVALMLYMQVPRQAFESERDKEQMLIDRGEQYKRAIYLYYVSNNGQWPSRMEDLENTNNHRYLRERYVDPYTGKDEWRLIHTNGSFLTDSLVTPPPAQGAPGVPGGALAGTGAATTQGFTITQSSAQQTPGAGTATPNAPPPLNAQAQRRASDDTMVSNSSYQTVPGNAPGPGNPGANQNGGDTYQPFNPATLPPISLYPNGYNAPAANVPGAAGGNGQPNPGGLNPGGAQPFNPGLNPANPANPAQPGVNPTGTNPNGVNVPGLNQTPGVPPINLPGTNFPMTNPGITAPNPGAIGSQNPPGSSPNQNYSTSGFSNQGFSNQGFSNQGGAATSTIPAANGAGNLPPGVGPPGGANPAANLINQLLTQPRQPPAGIGNSQPTNGGGGLAGVASTYKGTTIKSYFDRTKYQEWEFVYKPNSQLGIQPPTPGQGPNGSGGIPSGNPGAPGGAAGPGGPAGPGMGAPGAAPGFGGQGGFGTQGATGASSFGAAPAQPAGGQSSPFFSQQ